MQKILIANTEKWLIPHFESIGEFYYLQQAKTKDFDLFDPEIPLVIGFEYISDFTELGALADLLHIVIKTDNLKKVVYLSSYGVYSPKKSQYVEDDLISPMNFVGTRAAMLEDALVYFSRRYEIDLTILRLFNPYGPFQTSPYVIPSVLESIATKGTVRIGDSEKVRDFIYVTDLMKVINRVLELDKDGLKIYNVGFGKTISIHELIIEAQEITKGSCDVIFDATKLREEYDYDYAVADISKIKKELNWEPKVDLKTGLSLTYQWILGRSGKGV